MWLGDLPLPRAALAGLGRLAILLSHDPLLPQQGYDTTVSMLEIALQRYRSGFAAGGDVPEARSCGRSHHRRLPASGVVW
jgi:hypothetical protein